VVVKVRYGEDRISKGVFFIYLTFVSDFFVLILKRVQHRYKEAILRSFGKLRTGPSIKLRAEDKAAPLLSFPNSLIGNPCFYLWIPDY